MKRFLILLIVLTGILCTKNEHPKLVADNIFDVTGSNWNPPTVTAMNDTLVPIKDTITLSASALDKDGSIAEFYWILADRSDTLYSDTLGYKISFSKADTIKGYVIAGDNNGIFSAPDSFTIEVREYKPVQKANDDIDISVMDSVKFTVSAIDSNGPIDYYWCFGNDTLFMSTGKDSILDTLFMTEGSVRVVTKVMDDDSLFSNADTFNVNVHLHRPTISTGISVLTAATGQAISISTEAFDTNGVIMGYMWAINGTDFNISSSSTLDTAFSETGMKTVLVKAFDDDSIESLVDTVRILIKGTEPLLYAPINGSEFNNRKIKLSFIPGYNNSSYTVLMAKDSGNFEILDSGITDSSYSFNALGYGNSYRWAIMGFDSLGLLDTSDIWEFTIAPNNAPIFNEDSIALPQNIFTDSLFEVELVNSDVNGDTVTLSILNGPAGATLKGDTLVWLPTIADTGLASFSVVASDGFGGRDTILWSCTVEKTIYKGIPIVTVQPSNITIDVGDSTVFSARAIGGNLSYSWLKDNVPVISASSNDLPVSNAVWKENGYQYKCIVTNSFGSCTTDAAILTVQRTGLIIKNCKLLASNNGNINDDITGVVGGNKVSFSVPYGTMINQLKLNFNLPDGATISPDTSQLVDLSSPALFIVTAENGDFISYSINVTFRPIYVDSSATGNNDGSSWENAYNDLQDGLNASVSGSEVWVAKAVYRPSVVNGSIATFNIKEDISLYGGFLGGELNFSERDSVFNKAYLRGDLVNDTAYHVITINNVSGKTSISGFSIMNGAARSEDIKYGGGVYIYRSDVIISSCVLMSNSSYSGGGAIFSDTSTLKINACVFRDNSGNGAVDIMCRGGEVEVVNSDLGGINITNNNSMYFYGGSSLLKNSVIKFYNDTILKSSIRSYLQTSFSMDSCELSNCNNVHVSGSATISNCSFKNLTSEFGGALHVVYDSAMISNCLFDSCSAVNGGAIYSQVDYLNVKNCTFSNNISLKNNENSHLGSDLIVLKVEYSNMENCSFYGDSGQKYSIVFTNDSCKNIAFTNCTFNKDSDVYFYNYNDSITFLNCILNKVNVTSGKAVKVQSSIINESQLIFSNPLEIDTIIADPLLGHLITNGSPIPTMAIPSNSPAKDAGTLTGAPQYDARGVLRPQGSGIDIGAFELEE